MDYQSNIREAKEIIKECKTRNALINSIEAFKLKAQDIMDQISILDAATEIIHGIRGHNTECPEIQQTKYICYEKFCDCHVIIELLTNELEDHDE